MIFLQTQSCLVLNVHYALGHGFEKGYATVLNSNVARITNNCVLLTIFRQYIKEAIVLEVCDITDFIGVSKITFEEKSL